MQELFTRANEALYDDLSRYAATLRAIMEALPRAKRYCEQVAAEVRLVQAILAFGNGPEVAPLQQISLQLSSLWGVRDDLPVRATGFSVQLAESVRALEQAQRGLALASGRAPDTFTAELGVCFTNITSHVEAQKQILEQCEEHLRPFRASPDLTRKRLNLLIAAAEARLPDSPARQNAVEVYAEAAALLAGWESGITLDDQGIAVLERCLGLLSQNGTLVQLIEPVEPLSA
jgi:hypothetical protein